MTAMLNTGTNVNVSDNKNKSTPLHLAVNQGNDAGVRSLLASRHCDVNCQVKIVFANKKLSAGETPLPPPPHWDFLVRVCRPVLQILTLFQTKKMSFSTPFLRPGPSCSKAG